MAEIAEIISEIKAKVHEIDAQLNAVEVGELPDMLANPVNALMRSWDQLKYQMSAMNSDRQNIDWRWMVTDILTLLTPVRGYLQLISQIELRFGSSPQVTNHLREIDQFTREIWEILHQWRDAQERS